MISTKLKSLIDAAQHIVIVQADNPDGDSLSSSLALEDLLGSLGKKTTLYCGTDIPTYLHYMQGWDRVVNELPKQFDLSIIVDTSAIGLLETLEETRELAWLKSKPSVVIDHHVTEATIDFALLYRQTAVSTGEIIYDLAKQYEWPIKSEVADLLAMSILSDSLGLTSEAVTAKSIYTLAELVERGADLAAIDDIRRNSQRKAAKILKYKGVLLQRVEYSDDGQIATIDIPWAEIEKYSHAYNPSMLVIDEMRMVEGVKLAVAFKIYPDGRITAKIRANYSVRVANMLAEHFNGGGHPYAAGFKITSGKPFKEVKSECIKVAQELLKQLPGDQY